MRLKEAMRLKNCCKELHSFKGQAKGFCADLLFIKSDDHYLFTFKH